MTAPLRLYSKRPHNFRIFNDKAPIPWYSYMVDKPSLTAHALMEFDIQEITDETVMG
jgi:hypothetical protein